MGFRLSDHVRYLPPALDLPNRFLVASQFGAGPAKSLGTIYQIHGVPLSRNVPMPTVLEYKRQNLGTGMGFQRGGETVMGTGTASRSLTAVMGASSSEHTGRAHSARLPGSPTKRVTSITALQHAGMGTRESEAFLGLSGGGIACAYTRGAKKFDAEGGFDVR